jgi:hypothetical protein
VFRPSDTGLGALAGATGADFFRRHSSNCDLAGELVGAAHKGPFAKPLFDIADSIRDAAFAQSNEWWPTAGCAPPLSCARRDQKPLVKPILIDVFARPQSRCRVRNRHCVLHVANSTLEKHSTGGEQDSRFLDFAMGESWKSNPPALAFAAWGRE